MSEDWWFRAAHNWKQNGLHFSVNLATIHPAACVLLYVGGLSYYLFFVLPSTALANTGIIIRFICAVWLINGKAYNRSKIYYFCHGNSEDNIIITHCDLNLKK